MEAPSNYNNQLQFNHIDTATVATQPLKPITNEQKNTNALFYDNSWLFSLPQFLIK